ncbi:MAG TPA: hypothetical protein VLT62_02035 [Candidatus Methylomirabilis sp.]|nr:hypothetical protein [Candidatus Methylomirabilis sp.]HSB80839.1 hypothetical protein [Candidatus Methylomirabilis sp.]
MGTTINLYAAWVGIFLGFIAGALPGLFFHKPDWLGGYASWARRMVRLAHISFFGLAFINLAFALSAPRMGLPDVDLILSSRLLVLGAASMPAVCYLAALWQPFRHLFFLPVGSLVLGVGLLLYRGVLR